MKKAAPHSILSKPHSPETTVLCVYSLDSTSLQTPLLSSKCPRDLRKITRSYQVKDWRGGAEIGTERIRKLIRSKRTWLRSKGKNHFHISRQTTETSSEHSRLKQMRHCAFPMWTGLSPDPSRAPQPPQTLLLAESLCETELGHLSFSFALPPTQALESKCLILSLLLLLTQLEFNQVYELKYSLRYLYFTFWSAHW